MFDQWTIRRQITSLSPWSESVIVHGILAAGLMIPTLFSHNRGTPQPILSTTEIRFTPAIAAPKQNIARSKPKHSTHPKLQASKITHAPLPVIRDHQDEVLESAQIARTPSQSPEDTPIGITTSKTSVENLFLTEIVRRIDSHKRFPRRAQIEGKEGWVHVSFELTADGSIEDLRLSLRSDCEDFDQAALAAVEAAEPFPSIPDSLQRDRWSLTIPIHFQLTRNP